MAKKVVKGFGPNDPETRFNSETSKRLAIEHLVKQGCRSIAHFTCPGPAVPQEQAEEDRIRAQFPNIVLDTFRFECNSASLCEQYNLRTDNLLDAFWYSAKGEPLHPADPDLTVGQYDGVVLEWDGTNCHRTNFENSDWSTMIEGINTALDLELKVVLTYTHSFRGDNAGRNPVGRPRRDRWEPTCSTAFASTYDKVCGKPWEGYFHQVLTKDLALTRAHTIWSSRNYYRYMKETSGESGLAQGGGGMPRWVFGLEV